MMRAFLILLSIIFLPLLSVSQNTLRGRVMDGETGTPLPGANVSLNGASGTTTDIEGYFNFEALEKGVYLLSVSYIGYKHYQQEIPVPQKKLLKITLEENILVTEEVLVTATRASENTPTTYSLVSKEELEDQNLGQDLPFLLNLTPSVVVTSDAGAGVGYTGIRIRGSDNTRINVTVNGIPINDAESHGVFWVNMPDLASSIENIQIQRGVGTSTNGAAAFGASINVQTNALNQEPYAEVDNAFGSFNTRKHTIRAGSGLLHHRFAVDMRLSSIASDGYIDRASADLKSFYFSGGYYGDNTMIKAIVFSGKEETYQAWYGTPESRINNDDEAMREHAANEGYTEEQLQNLLKSGRTYNYYTYENEVDHYQQDHYQLHLSQQIIEDLNFNGALHYTRGKGYYEQYRPDESFEDYQLEPLILGEDTISTTDLIRRRWLDNDFYGFTYALQFSPKRLSTTLGGGYNIYKGDHFGEIIWTRFASNSEIRDRYYDNDATKKDFNIYLKTNYEFTDDLIGYLDLQYRNIAYQAFGPDNDQQLIKVNTTFDFFNPKLGLLYKLNNSTDIYASAAVAHREPVRSDFTDAPDEKTPKPEVLRNIETGIKRSGTALSYAINYYLMDYQNQLVLTGELNDVGAPIRTNVDKSYRTGIELSATYAIAKEIILSGNITFSRNKIGRFEEVIYDYTDGYDIIENEFESTDISYSPNVIAGGQILVKPLNGLEVSLLPKYVGEQYLDNTSNENRKIDRYFINDLRVKYLLPVDWAKEIALNVLVNNIFDVAYVSNGFTYSYIYGKKITENFYYPQAGINFLAGLSVKL